MTNDELLQLLGLQSTGTDRRMNTLQRGGLGNLVGNQSNYLDASGGFLSKPKPS